MDALRLAALLIYTFGVFAYGMILALWLQELSVVVVARRSAGAASAAPHPDLASGALLAVSFLWFVCNAAVLLAGLSARPHLWHLDVAVLFLAFSFPPLIMHSTLSEQTRAGVAPQGRMWQALLWPAYLVAIGVPLLSLIGFLGRPDAATERTLSLILTTALSSSFIGAAIYSSALIARQPAPAQPRGRNAGRWVLALFGLLVLLFVVLFAIGVSIGSGEPVPAWGLVIEVAARSLPLLFLSVAVYFESRVQFFDLFVKLGLSMLATIGILTLAFAVALPVLDRFDRTWASPWIYGIVLLPVVMILPRIFARIGSVLDRRWLGRRFTAVEAVTRFLEGLRASTTATQLAARAEEGLAEIFGAPAAVELGNSSGDAPGRFVAVHEVAIRSGDTSVGRIRMGRRQSEAPYFSEDVVLLSSLADVFASVLANIRLQQRQQEQERQAREASLHASRSELRALRAQINPHFLFNALNVISGLIHRDPAVADRTVERLADVFRYTLRGASSEWSTLDDELEFVRACLDVEHARFGSRLRTSVTMTDDIRSTQVPTMIVQTLVENAVKHGAAAMRGQAVIRVHARRQGAHLVIDVEDNGPGIALPLGLKDGSGYGLSNVRQRLEGYFGREATLDIGRNAAGDRTVATITLPLVSMDHYSQLSAAENRE